jgi:hypothetical protein
MPRKKQRLTAQPNDQVNKQAEMSPTQTNSLKPIEDRITARNWLKLKMNHTTGNYEPKETDSAMAGLQALEATGMADLDAASQLVKQVINAQPEQGSLSSANSAIAMLQGIGPQDEVEGLLASQMVAVHHMAMEFSRRAMGGNLTTDQADRLINRTTKLMRTFKAQVEALQKYRTNGQQRITVHHVHVNQGGQALIGDLRGRPEERPTR